MKSNESTKASGASGASGADIAVTLNLSELVQETIQASRSRQGTITEHDLSSILGKVLAAADQPLPDLEFDLAELEYDPVTDLSSIPSRTADEGSSPSASSPTTSTKSRPITIRVPVTVLAAFKAMAQDKRVAYQTLINRKLRLGLSMT